MRRCPSGVWDRLPGGLENSRIAFSGSVSGGNSGTGFKCGFGNLFQGATSAAFFNGSKDLVGVVIPTGETTVRVQEAGI
jgi:hypothetical protein